MASTHLNFALDVDDGWPPVATECVPFERVSTGYRTLSAPLFVKDLSVDDIIEPDFDANGLVTAWKHVSRSENTTIWLLRLAHTTQLDIVLARLRDLDCNTVSGDSLGCYAIDVPKRIPMAVVDEALAALDTESVAFPSFRHAE